MRLAVLLSLAASMLWAGIRSAAAADPSAPGPAGGQSPGTPASSARPNLLMIVADDLGTTLGCYGDPNAKTPGLDRFAAGGVRFTHAFCTAASCSPSRSVILSGQHTHTNGMYGLQHGDHKFSSRPGLRSLPGLLAESGYVTAVAGKLHVGPPEAYPFSRVLKAPATQPDALAAAAGAFFAEKRDQPFFLYFCTVDPHRSGGDGVPPGRVDSFGNRRQPAGTGAVTFDPAGLKVPAFLPDTEAVRQELAQYYQSVARFDAGVSRLLDGLEKSGQLDNTVIFILSDNGVAFPGAKTTLYEPGMRLPLMVQAPGLKRKGMINEAMVSWTDLAPTLLDYAGLQAPSSWPGRSFRPVLETERPEHWDRVFGSHQFHEVTMYYPMRVLRTRQYKLIHNLAWRLEHPSASDLWNSATWQDVLKTGREFYGRRRTRDFLFRPEWELYDLTADPDEIRNLAADPAHAEALSGLRSGLKTFQQQTRDPWLIKHRHE